MRLPRLPWWGWVLVGILAVAAGFALYYFGLIALFYAACEFNHSCL